MPFRIFFRHVADNYEADTLEESSTSSLAPCAYEGVANWLPYTVHASRNRCEKSFLKWTLRHKRSKNESLVIPKMDI